VEVAVDAGTGKELTSVLTVLTARLTAATD
jgi:hypothetical protein